jgi:hypothetical protein
MTITRRILKLLTIVFASIVFLLLPTQFANARGGSGGSGGSGFSGSGTSAGIYTGGRGGQSAVEIPLSPKISIGLLESFAAVVLLLLPAAFFSEISNFVRFNGKDFSEDVDLVKYTQEIVPNFTNRYSVKHHKLNGNWQTASLKPAIDFPDYRQLADKLNLSENVCRLFAQYERDWTHKQFSAMEEYVVESFCHVQPNIFQENYGNNTDINYLLEPPEISVLQYDRAAESHFFLVHINAKIINFVVSKKGYVIAGQPFLRSFSEYWTFEVDRRNKWWLVTIVSQTARLMPDFLGDFWPSFAEQPWQLFLPK